MLGLLDDLILVPLGLWIAIRLLPPEVLAEHRRTAELAGARPVSRIGALAVIAIWLAAAVALLFFLLRTLA